MLKDNTHKKGHLVIITSLLSQDNLEAKTVAMTVDVSCSKVSPSKARYYCSCVYMCIYIYIERERYTHI